MTRALLLLLALAACPAPAARPTPVPPARPQPRPLPQPTVLDTPTTVRGKLVVLLVVDQLPSWSFTQKRPALSRGFDRLLREGEWLVGEYPSPATITAPGHALLGSGEPPYRSGILANEWWDRVANKPVTAVEDGEGSSARWLRVPALGDAVAAAATGAKAVSVSLKARAAILPLGQAGTPIWFDPKRIAWTSTRDVPWLADHNRTASVGKRLGETWTPLDGRRLATLSGTTDDARGELGEKGFGPTFPHALAQVKDRASAIYAMPLGNELVLQTALAAIDAEQLGKDDVPDLLVVSLSAHDYMGHGWGHESWEAWDMLLRLDEQLDTFLAALDAKVGAGAWAMIATSDHGASPLPERVGGGRTTYEQLLAAANRAASLELGGGTWIASTRYPYVHLSAAARARSAKDRGKALWKVASALRAFPGIARVEPTGAFAGNCDRRTGEARGVCLMIDPERAGELVYLPARHWIVHPAADPQATAHGSWNAYDREVPVVVVPFGRTPHIAASEPGAALIDMTRISTTLATWLGITPPRDLPRTASPTARR